MKVHSIERNSASVPIRFSFIDDREGLIRDGLFLTHSGDEIGGRNRYAYQHYRGDSEIIILDVSVNECVDVGERAVIGRGREQVLLPGERDYEPLKKRLEEIGGWH